MAENGASEYIEGHTNIVSQQDGETPRISKVVLQSPNATFTCKWVGIRWSISRPLRSPDLTQLDLIVRGQWRLREQQCRCHS
jgi:hypothetical protein